NRFRCLPRSPPPAVAQLRLVRSMPPPQEDEQWLRDLEKQFRDLPDDRVQAEIERYLPDTTPRKILLGILAERQRAVQEPEKERFRQTYEQSERHHSESHRHAIRAEVVAWIALGISVISFLLQQCIHSHRTP